jgi:DUF971 family protein
MPQTVVDLWTYLRYHKSAAVFFVILRMRRIMQKFRPTHIERGNTSLTIRWKDSHQSELSYRLLREKCPCARCDATRSGKDPFHILPSDDFFDNLHLVDIQQVGRYAVRLVWSDGHRTGIYTFQFLRELSEDAN